MTGLGLCRTRLTLLLLSLVPLAGAAAQDPASTPNPTSDRIYRIAPPGQGERISVLTNRRARFGISVNFRTRETDSIGALVQSVTPGGPASKAGIRSGDIITRVNGQSLLQPPGNTGRDDSSPGLRLTEIAARLDPNDTVAVEFRRGTQRRTVQLVTGDEPTFVFTESDDGPGFRVGEGLDDGMRPGDDPMRRSMTFSFNIESLPGRLPPMQHMRLMDGPMMFALGSPLADLELAPLNPDLGRYFGATEGILVISLPPESGLGLKGGDVILAVDGRAPSSTAQLLRILRSYEPGQEIKFDIMRDKRRQVVVGRIAER